MSDFWSNYYYYALERMHKLIEKNENIKVDLHIHSNYSADGKQDCVQILQTSIDRGLDVISITDHDENRAYYELEKIMNDKNYDFYPLIIPGTELNVKYDEYSNRCHVLKYYFNPYDIEFGNMVMHNLEANKLRSKIQFKRLEDNVAFQWMKKKYKITYSFEEYQKYIEDNAYVYEYDTLAMYLLKVLHVCNGTVKELYLLERDVVALDKCVKRKEIREKNLEKLKEKYIYTNRIETPRALLNILSIPECDDFFYPSESPIGCISVNSYNQIDINDIPSCGITSFAHPNEEKLDEISRYIERNPETFQAIEINARNKHCQVERIMDLVHQRGLIYTTGSDNHGMNADLYNSKEQFFNMDCDNFKKFTLLYK